MTACQLPVIKVHPHNVIHMHGLTDYMTHSKFSLFGFCQTSPLFQIYSRLGRTLKVNVWEFLGTGHIMDQMPFVSLYQQHH